MKDKRINGIASKSHRHAIVLGEIHIWKIYLDVSNELVQIARGVLSRDEVDRADRFRLEGDRRRFTIAHAAMREILAHYLAAEPRRLTFEYGAQGKPRLVAARNAGELKFNFSHSSDLALLGVTRQISVGIDLEAVCFDFAVEEIAQSFFSADEVRTLLELPKGLRVKAFFCCWTRKEAYIKALGKGLSIPLDSFSVEFRPNEPAGLLRVESDTEGISCWSIYNIEIDSAYAGALVAEGKGHKICLWSWLNGFCIPGDKQI